jgi:integrase
MVKFTPISIKNLKPAEVRKEYPDGGCSGLYLVLQPSGRKSFALRARLKGKSAKVTLGRFVFDGPKGKGKPKIGDALTLASARVLAAAVMEEIAGGGDPVASRRQAKDEEERRRADTFRAVAEQHLKRECGMRIDDEGTVTFDASKLRSGREQWLMLRRAAFPVFGGSPIAQIKKSDIINLLDRLADGELRDHKGKKLVGGPVAADRLLAVLRKIFAWHAGREDDFRSPIVAGMRRVKASEQSRERILTDDELRVIWLTACQLQGPFAGFVRFLLLTGARRTEASAMTWAEVSPDGWLLPASRNKVKRDLLRPLSREAQALLASQPRIVGCEYVFSGDGERSITGYSRLKRQFDEALSEELQNPIPRWTLHDLRRTARSLMSRSGVPSDHAERCLGHVITGVRGIYDQHRYHPEMQAAYEKLAAQIERIVNPAVGNVVAFQAAAESAI